MPIRSPGEPGSVSSSETESRQARQADTVRASLSWSCVLGEERGGEEGPGAHHREERPEQGRLCQRGVRCWPSPASPPSRTLPRLLRIHRLCPRPLFTGGLPRRGSGGPDRQSLALCKAPQGQWAVQPRAEKPQGLRGLLHSTEGAPCERGEAGWLAQRALVTSHQDGGRCLEKSINPVM